MSDENDNTVNVENDTQDSNTQDEFYQLPKRDTPVNDLGISNKSSVVRRVGGHDLVSELKQFEKEHFDLYSFRNILPRYTSILNHLGTAIRDRMDDISVTSDEITKRTNNTEVRGQTWSESDNVWYGVAKLYASSMRDFMTMTAYKDWQLDFLRTILNRVLLMVDNLGAVGEMQVIAKAKESMAEKQFHTMQLMQDKQTSMTMTVLDNVTKKMIELTDSQNKQQQTLMNAMMDNMQRITQDIVKRDVEHNHKSVKPQVLDKSNSELSKTDTIVPNVMNTKVTTPLVSQVRVPDVIIKNTTRDNELISKNPRLLALGIQIAKTAINKGKSPMQSVNMTLLKKTIFTNFCSKYSVLDIKQIKRLMVAQARLELKGESYNE